MQTWLYFSQPKYSIQGIDYKRLKCQAYYGRISYILHYPLTISTAPFKPFKSFSAAFASLVKSNNTIS